MNEMSKLEDSMEVPPNEVSRVHSVPTDSINYGHDFTMNPLNTSAGNVSFFKKTSSQQVVNSGQKNFNQVPLPSNPLVMIKERSNEQSSSSIHQNKS